MTNGLYTTHTWRNLRKQRLTTAANNNEPCCRCHQPIDYTLPGNTKWGPTLDHLTPLAHGGQQLPPPNQLAPAHNTCNSRHGGRIGNQRQGLGKGSRGGQGKTAAAKANGARFGTGPVTAPLAPAMHTHTGTADYGGLRAGFGGNINDCPWIAPILDRMPPNAAPPLAMTAPHPRAVGSYGPQAVEWIRKEMALQPRWFQELSFARIWEHDRDGQLVWRLVLKSTPRRVGKSIFLRCGCVWRVAHADLFGEPQVVLFTGKDLPSCKDIHRQAWVWAKARGWIVRRGMGNEEIEAPDESRWIVRSQDGVFGYPAGMGACDESWKVPAPVINEGLIPAVMERRSPQVLLTSTAHTKATALMVRMIAEALGSLDGSGPSLLLLWASPRDSDPADPAVWRAASPHWDELRESLIADAWRRAAAGATEHDPDEPDPVAGFKAQYLNTWPSLSVARPAVVRVPAGQWDGLRSGALFTGPAVAVAVESAGGMPPVVVKAFMEPEGWVGVHAERVASAADALEVCRVGRPLSLLVGKSLLTDPAWRDLGAVPMTGSVGDAAAGLLRLLGDGLLRHDGSPVLSGQVSALQAVQGPGGLRVTSREPLDAVKALVWAVDAARDAPVPFRIRVKAGAR